MVWLDNLFSSIKLFKRLKSLSIGAAGTIKTTHIKQEEMDNRAIDKNTKGQIESKKKVPTKYFLALFMDLKLSYNK